MSEIAKMRERLGLSRAELAARLGVTRQSVEQLEQREAAGTASLGKVAEAAQAMGARLEYGLVRNIAVRLSALGAEPTRDVTAASVEERLEMVWPMTCDAWAFYGGTTDAESGLPRHVVRIHRGGR